LSVNRRFGGTYRLHLQGKKYAEQETSMKACHMISCWFLAQLIFEPEDGGGMFL
jgi:hypothetical protein